VIGIANSSLELSGGTALSEVAMVSCGVRQGGVISPVLFNVFINVFINRLRSLQIGCHVNGLFLGCLFYADDVLFPCPSVTGLQYMLDVCVATGDMLSLKFNPLNSQCLAIGKFASVSLPSMRLDSHPIHWASSIKYLGVYIVSSRKLLFNIASVKKSFLLPVTLFMLRLRVLMRRCIYPSKRVVVFLF